METYPRIQSPGLPGSRRPDSPMPRAERAKQFMAFDAMKGLQEALRDREERHSREPRRVFCEEEAQALDGRLRRLRAGMTVKLTFYCRFHERVVTDVVREVGESSLLIGHEWVEFGDVYKIAVLEVPGK